MHARADYGARIPAAARGGVVATVAAGSPAAQAFIEPGDEIRAVDGSPLRDVIDWQWLADGDSASILAVKPGGLAEEFTLIREPGQPWGLTFTETVFDGVRTCRNRCAFCFMTQLPRGLRRALYLRDDDYRLSFLQGNFVSLTNLDDADVERIAEQNLSPLYVSLHAEDADVRDHLICAQDDRGLERFDQLLDAGIDLHVQIVLVPGVNDGDVLERSLRWLAEREGVESVGIVPLGYTGHQQEFSASYGGSHDALNVIEQLWPWQKAFRARDGITWVYLADEFYLNAGIEVAPAEHYDGFPQYENGIGLVRSYLDEVESIRKDLATALEGVVAPIAFVTGTLFAPVLTSVLRSLVADSAFGAAEHDPVVRVLAVENRFFGGNVSVTGLLTASDLVPAIASLPEGTIALVPDIVANADGLLLDDVPASELGMRTSREVRLISCDAGGLLGGLLEAAATPH